MKAILMRAVCAAALCTGPGAIAAAQQETSASAAGQDVITVTARKREEDITDVPAAVTALNAEQADLLALDGVEDYLRQFPSTILVKSGPEYLNDISIRGQGGGRVGFSETATGLYRNGVYIAGGGYGGRSLSRMDFFDQQRIEVLRGPQGALFGRNAVGGAVNVISRRPELDEASARLTGEYTFETERTNLEAVVNLPLAEDEFAIRVGAFNNDQEDGFHTNLTTGNTVDVSSHSGVRASALWAPSDTLELLVMAEHYESTTPGFANMGYRASRFNGTPLDPDPYVRIMSDEAFVDIEQDSLFIVADGDAGFGSWRASLGWASRDGARVNEDLDHFIGFQDAFFGPNEVVLFATQTEGFERLGGELYFASNEEGPLTWLFGAEFQTFESDVFTANFGNGVIAPLRALARDDNSVEELTSIAAFAAFGYEASERLDLGLELRVQRDEKDFTFDRTQNQADSLAVEFSVTDTDSWTNVIPVFTADYAVDENHTIYGRLATGYRPGGFNTGLPDTVPNAETLIPYDPEYAISGEAGWKAVMGPWRLAAAAFYTRTEDAQIVTNAGTTNNTFILQNAGDTTVYGVEFEAGGRFEVGPGTLNLNLGLSSNDGEYGDDTLVIFAGVTEDISGLRVSRTRDLNAQISTSYFFPLVPGFEGFLSGSAQFERGGPEDARNLRALPDFDLFDARIGVRNDTFTLSVFAKNLTDERYLIQTVSSNEYWSSGRTWGVRVSADF
ncbi:MAG: TonB-dependent receptor [Pseudomonadota bacterium]